MRSQKPLLIMMAAALILGASPAGQSRQERFVADLQQADQRLAIVANRLLIANTRLCGRLMPATGVTILALDQYPPQMRPAASKVLGFDTSVGIEVVVPGSAAVHAGLLPGDGIVAINDQPVPGKLAGSDTNSKLRDATERTIAALPPDRPIVFKILRSGRESAAIVQPDAACRSRFEMVPGSRPMAHSDGETIQISSGFLARFGDSALAVIFAHELAHTILKHREQLAAAQRDKKQLAREAEREADRLSVHLLANAGYDPRIAPEFWREHGDAIGFLSFGDTVHDSPRKRIATLEAEIGLLNPKPEPPR